MLGFGGNEVFLKGRSSVTQRKRSEVKLTTREDKERGVRLRSVIVESSLPDLSDGQTGLHRCFDVPTQTFLSVAI